MKKIFATILCLLCCFSFTSCSYEYDGLKNYNDGNNSIGMDEYLPSKTFLEDYTYLYGDYHMYEPSAFFNHNADKSFMYLCYEEDVYMAAKEFLFENMILSKENSFSYNGYTFMQEYNDDTEIDPFSPGINWNGVCIKFHMAGYHDERNMLFFFGVSDQLDTEEEIALATNFQIDKFLDYYFDDWFDFDR